MSYLSLNLLVLFISPIQTCKWSPNQCGCSLVSPSIGHRIVGGTEATRHSWPWIVSVRKRRSHICGGALITNRHVLTAAHCFRYYHPMDLPLYTFAMGHHDVMEEKFVSKAKSITLHASYDSNGHLNHDIALIELEQTVDLNDNQMGFICLPLSHVNDNGAYPPIGTTTWVMGWGATRFEGTAAPTLRQVSVPITNNAGCVRTVTDPTKQICAGYDRGGKDSCQGDSGGPLVIEVKDGLYELIGIVSFGENCAKALKPGIYTRVSGYIDWINSNMHGTKPSGSQDNQLSSLAGWDIMGVLPEGLASSKEDPPKMAHFFLLIELFFLL